jgi:hypothetical protein
MINMGIFISTALTNFSADILVATLAWDVLNIAAIEIVTLIGSSIIWLLRSNESNLA